MLTHGGARASAFPTTRWSRIFTARQPQTGRAQQALAALCEAYWRPSYAYLRRQGCNADEAQDTVQAFFVHLLEKPMLLRADPERGRFRALLRVSLKHFLSNQRSRDRAIKRGAGVLTVLSNLESAESWCRLEPLDHDTPDRLYDRRWALLVLDRVMNRLRAEFVRAGKASLFDAMAPYLTCDGEPASYRSLGADLDMTEGAVRVAVHRLRRRYNAVLHDEIGQTVATPEQIADEIRYLRAVLGGGRY
jgi:DNA-directed RNA polymerase specialized sigma24 family protein